MKKLILLALLIVGCAPKPIKPIMIIDGDINTNSTTFWTDVIKEECKKNVKHILNLQMKGVILCINVLEM